MDVVTLVEAPPGPQGATVECRHLAPFGVHLVHPRKTMLTSELRRMTVLIEKLGHAFDAEHRAVVKGEQILAQPQLHVMFALVTQTVLGLRAGQLEARLTAIAVRAARAATHIAPELQGLGLGHGQTEGQGQQAGRAARSKGAAG
ncbi:hypothetical protein D3C84_293590 [compost metagenome]